MTRTTVLAAAFVVVLVGCGEQCKNETPPLNQAVPIGADCSVNANEQFTLLLSVCPKCNQAQPVCVADLDAVADGQIVLDLQAEACEESNSCSTEGCAAAPIPCRFTAPSTPDTYNLNIVEENQVVTRELSVRSTGGTGTCG